VGAVRGSGASTGCNTTATGRATIGGIAIAKRTETLIDGLTQQDEPLQTFVGLITVPMLCRLQQLCPLAERRQHSMPFRLGPDHMANSGIDCISKNSASNRPLEQRRWIAQIARRIDIASRVS